MKIRVYYEDTDTGGVVYHSNYLNFCERARSELFFKEGLSPHKEDQFFVVKHIDANFIKPALLGDLLDVKTNIENIKNASLVMKQDIFKKGELIFSCLIKLAYLKEGKVSKIPAVTLKLFTKE